MGKVTALSLAMQEVLGILSRVAPTELTVTLIGETGTGKDVLAHAVHDNSARAAKPFVWRAFAGLRRSESPSQRGSPSFERSAPCERIL